MNNKDMSDLLPCPFCGGNPEYVDNTYGSHWVTCMKCFCSTSDIHNSGSMESAIKTWNTRVDLAYAPKAAEDVSDDTCVAYKQGKIDGWCECTEWLQSRYTLTEKESTPPNKALDDCLTMVKSVLSRSDMSPLVFSRNTIETLVESALRNTTKECE